jgi:hypothetical protein
VGSLLSIEAKARPMRLSTLAGWTPRWRPSAPQGWNLLPKSSLARAHVVCEGCSCTWAHYGRCTLFMPACSSYGACPSSSCRPTATNVVRARFGRPLGRRRTSCVVTCGAAPRVAGARAGECGPAFTRSARRPSARPSRATPQSAISRSR